jgi:hypothetical protein
MNLSYVNRGIGGALEDLLKERFQQEQLAELTRRQAVEEARLASELKLRQQQESRVAAEQAAARENLEAERQYRRAQNLAQSSLPGDVLDDKAVSALTDAGLGGMIRTKKAVDIDIPGVTEGLAGLTDLGGAPAPKGGVMKTTMRLAPEENTSTGGSMYRDRETARQAAKDKAEADRAFKAEEAEKARAAAAAEKQRDRELKEMIAKLSASKNAESQALGNVLKQQQIDKENERKADADKTKQRTRANALALTNETIGALEEMATFTKDASGKTVVELKPGVDNLYGMRNPLAGYVPGSDTANAAASRDRLTGRLVGDFLNELKSQSRTGATGFGALTERELAIIENSASKLKNANMSETAVKAELARLHDKLSTVYTTTAESTSAGASPVKKFNPKTGKVE